MDIKKCVQCGKEYESEKTSGHEQKYCSKSCRYKAANKRREDSMAEKFRREIQPGTNIGNEKTEIQREFVSDSRKDFGLSAERIIELISTNANLTAENKRLEEKIKHHEIEYNRLESEFEELEQEMKSQENSNSMISGVNQLVDKVSPFIPVIYGLFASKKTETNAKAKTA